MKNKKVEPKTLRHEFYRLVANCSCVLRANGMCTPDKCYANLYRLLFPKGGFPWQALNKEVKREIEREGLRTLGPPETNRLTRAPAIRRADKVRGGDI